MYVFFRYEYKFALFSCYYQVCYKLWTRFILCHFIYDQKNLAKTFDKIYQRRLVYNHFKHYSAKKCSIIGILFETFGLYKLLFDNFKMLRMKLFPFDMCFRLLKWNEGTVKAYIGMNMWRCFYMREKIWYQYNIWHKMIELLTAFYIYVTQWDYRFLRRKNITIV